METRLPAASSPDYDAAGCRVSNCSRIYRGQSPPIHRAISAVVSAATASGCTDGIPAFSRGAAETDKDTATVNTNDTMGNNFLMSPFRTKGINFCTLHPPLLKLVVRLVLSVPVRHLRSTSTQGCLSRQKTSGDKSGTKHSCLDPSRSLINPFRKHYPSPLLSEV